MLACLIIQRYFAKEIGRVLGAVTGILWLIAISNRFVILLGRVARGELPGVFLFKILGYMIPELLSFLLPLAFFFSILLVHGRWMAEKELTALYACGMPPKILLRPLWGIGLVLFVGVGLFTTWLNPELKTQKERLLSEEEVILLLRTLAPQRFHSFQGGRLIFYAEKVSMDKTQLQGIFIAEQPKIIVTAAEGKILHREGQVLIRLKKGVRYEGVPGQAEYTKIQFGEYTRVLKNDGAALARHHSVISTVDLWKKSELRYQAELQWRLAPPISVVVLLLLALPLSRIQPRQGQFGKLFPSILIYIVYYNLLTMSKRWIEAGTIPVWMGLSWVHLSALLLALVLQLKQKGYWPKCWGFSE